MKVQLRSFLVAFLVAALVAAPVAFAADPPEAAKWDVRGTRVAMCVTDDANAYPVMQRCTTAGYPVVSLPVGTAAADPCQSPGVVKTSVAVAATADAQLVALTAGQTIYVCGFSFSLTGTAPTARLVYGTGSVCATGLTALTGAYIPTSGSVVSSGGGGYTVTKTAAANALCIDVEGTSPSAQGVLTYVKQ